MFGNSGDAVTAGDGQRGMVRTGPRWSALGRAARGEFLGRPPTGKTFSVQQIHIYRIADGKIIEHWACRDDLDQGIQLGLIPVGQPAGTSATHGGI